MSTPQQSADRIVVGIDGSESSKTALRWALFMADTLHGEVQAVAAWDVSAGWAGAGWATMPVEWNPAEDNAKMLHDTIREVLGGQHPANVTAVVRQGGAAQVLIEASEGAQMLVVGSRGHGGFAGLLLGSVSTACAEHGSCPVLVVHGSNPPASAT